MPVGFRVRLDADAKQLRPDLWFGGSPARVLRLTGSGRTAWARLQADGVRTPAVGRLARRLTDAGLAHPVPPEQPVELDVTVLVPVLDRPEALDRCLRALGRSHPVVVVDDGSRDPAPIAHVAHVHGARLVRRPRNGGPAAARNSGLDSIASEFVAFIDSDCVPPSGWIEALAPHLGDPALAAVAPRISSVRRDDTGRFSWSARYTQARGGLDLGSRSGLVAPKSRVAYVPTAAVLVRRQALLDVARRDYVFDPALRYGEDVDLVWRLHAAGWRVRYEPDVLVGHEEPVRWSQLLQRRFRYGTSAAPLSRAHPDAITPLVVHPWATATVLALLAQRPLLAAGAFAMTVRGTTTALRSAGVPTDGSTAAMAGAVHQTWLGLGRFGTQFAAPLLAAAAAAPGRPGRRLAALSLLLGPPLHAWAPQRRHLDPGRFVLAHVADEIAYGAGVWAGCLRGRTLAPVRPGVIRRRAAAPSEAAPTEPAAAHRPDRSAQRGDTR